jgi:hypothetical protein
MGKNLMKALLICCAIAFSITQAMAAQPAANKEMVEALLIKMQIDLHDIDKSGDLAPVTGRTIDLLDNLHTALQNNDPEFLRAAVYDYTAAIKTIPAQEIDPTCGPSLLFGLFSNTVSLINTVRAGGDTVCLVVNVTSIIANIISDIQSYNICVIDNSSDPDEITRQQIVQRQVLVETYDFLASAYDVFFCTLSPTFVNYLSLFFEFLDIFPEPPPDEPATAIH